MSVSEGADDLQLDWSRISGNTVGRYFINILDTILLKPVFYMPTLERFEPLRFPLSLLRASRMSFRVIPLMLVAPMISDSESEGRTHTHVIADSALSVSIFHLSWFADSSFAAASGLKKS